LDIAVLGGGLVVWIRTFWMVMRPLLEVLDLLLSEGGLVVGARTSWIRFWELILQSTSNSNRCWFYV